MSEAIRQTNRRCSLPDCVDERRDASAVTEGQYNAENDNNRQHAPWQEPRDGEFVADRWGPGSRIHTAQVIVRR